MEGGDSIFGDIAASGQTTSTEFDDTFIVGNGANGTTIQDFDLSPDGTGLSGRSNQSNDIVFIQVAAASLAGAGYSLNEIYNLVSDQSDSLWRDFVRNLEVEVVEATDSQQANTIYLSIDKDGDGIAHSQYQLGSIEFNDSGMEDGSKYNAVKMKDRIEDVLAQFVSADSDNAHVLEQFFGMDSLTAAELAALERAVDAGQEADTANAGDKAAVENAISASLTSESTEIQNSAAVQAVQNALTSQQVATATSGAEGNCCCRRGCCRCCG